METKEAKDKEKWSRGNTIATISVILTAIGIIVGIAAWRFPVDNSAHPPEEAPTIMVSPMPEPESPTISPVDYDVEYIEPDTTEDQTGILAVADVVYMDTLVPIDSNRYVGNMGDSFIGRVGTNNSATGLNRITYQHGLELWVARWNFRDEISWVWSEYDLSGEFNLLKGTLTVSDTSFNQTNFDTTIEILGDNEVLFSERVQGGFFPIDINISVEGVSVLKINTYDNAANRGGTSFILGNLRLRT